ncbi:MAG: OmpA family protein, partial [Bacteroidota bacterium]
GAQDNTHPIKVQLELNPIGGDEPDLVAKGVPTIKEKRIQFYFDFDSYELTEKSIQDLTDLAELLHREKDWQLEVVGYADQQGDHQYNLRLSQQRARKIVDFLNHQGIDIKQVVRNEGKGSLKESKEESLNRRVDVVLRR